MSDNTCELAIIGAGISGLGFAHLARRCGIDTLLLEATERLGGCIDSHQFETMHGPYWAELGAHTCYNSYGNLLQILEDTQQLGTLQAKEKLRYRIQTADGLDSIPSQSICLNCWECFHGYGCRTRMVVQFRIITRGSIIHLFPKVEKYRRY